MGFIKSLVLDAARKAGYDIQKPAAPASGNSMQAAVGRLVLGNIQPKTIIDVGAASGTWTRMAMNYWPAAQYRLIEPLQEQQPVLEALHKSHANVQYHLAVAGAAAGEITFHVSPDLDGSGVYNQEAPGGRKVPVVCIDDLAGASEGPYLIKLDTHGYEIPILEGAARTLQNTVAPIIEVYGFRVSPTCLLFHELSEKMHDLGFRLLDIVDIMRRKKDNAFWQADAIYIKKDHPLFEDNSYA